MVFVGDETGKIPYLQFVSKKMMSKIRNNIIFAMGWNSMAVALAVTGVIDPVLGTIVHNVGSVAVVLNSFLPLLAERKGHRSIANVHKQSAGWASGGAQVDKRE